MIKRLIILLSLLIAATTVMSVYSANLSDFNVVKFEGDQDIYAEINAGINSFPTEIVQKYTAGGHKISFLSHLPYYDDEIACGYYLPDSKDIHISTKEKWRRELPATVIHEIAHDIYFTTINKWTPEMNSIYGYLHGKLAEYGTVKKYEDAGYKGEEIKQEMISLLYGLYYTQHEPFSKSEIFEAAEWLINEMNKVYLL